MSFAKRALKKAIRLTAPLWHQPPVRDVAPAIESLRAEIGAATASPATIYWTDWSAELASSVAQRNPMEFLQWPVILRTMNVQGPAYIDAEFSHLQSRSQWQQIKNVLQEPQVGGNEPYWRYPWTSGNTVHHTYHLHRFEDQCAVKLASFSHFFEFGGGYGNLCRIIQKRGSAGEYAITDLPQFLALQRFYLHATGASATLLPPSEALAWLDSTNLQNALFIATWSFSEAPLAIRDPIAKFLPRFRGHLIAFQESFADVDNIAYFRDLAEILAATYECAIFEIEHLPGDFYFFALRK